MIQERTSYPPEKVDALELYLLNFCKFLNATGEKPGMLLSAFKQKTPGECPALLTFALPRTGVDEKYPLIRDGEQGALAIRQAATCRVFLSLGRFQPLIARNVMQQF